MEDNVAWKRVLLMGETDDDGGQLYALRHHLQAQKYKLIIYIPPRKPPPEKRTPKKFGRLKKIL